MEEIPYEKQLSIWIRNSEERFISYKKMLEGVHRDKDVFPPDDPFTITYKEDLRDSKNSEEINLKRLREEKTYYPSSPPWLDEMAMTARKKKRDVQSTIDALRKIEDLGIIGWIKLLEEKLASM